MTPGSHHHVSEPGASPFPYAVSHVTGSMLSQPQSDGLPKSHYNLRPIAMEGDGVLGRAKA